MQNEVSHYLQIQHFIEEQLRSNFTAAEHPFFVYWGIGELKSNLQRIIREHPIECGCAARFTESMVPLNVDIFAIVTDTKKFELLILEIKLVRSAGLREWSQLVGYCLVSGAKYGLLVNIDNGASSRLTQILGSDKYLSKIITLRDTKMYEHFLGFMQWDSLTRNLKYNNFGYIRTLFDLTDKIIAEFSKY